MDRGQQSACRFSIQSCVSQYVWTFSLFCVMVVGWRLTLFSRADDRECCLGSYLDMRARSAKVANIFRLCSCGRSGLLLLAEVLFPLKIRKRSSRFSQQHGQSDLRIPSRFDSQYILYMDSRRQASKQDIIIIIIRHS